MKDFFSAVLLAAALLGFAFSTSAHAASSHLLHGLFCNTEAQIDETLSHMARRLTPEAAVEVTNKGAIACVVADKISYMIARPFIIGTNRGESRGGTAFIKYRATLVGVLVGGNIRPVEPPVPIYFITKERLEGAAEIGGA